MAPCWANQNPSLNPRKETLSSSSIQNMLNPKDINAQTISKQDKYNIFFFQYFFASIFINLKYWEDKAIGLLLPN